MEERKGNEIREVRQSTDNNQTHFKIGHHRHSRRASSRMQKFKYRMTGGWGASIRGEHLCLKFSLDGNIQEANEVSFHFIKGEGARKKEKKGNKVAGQISRKIFKEKREI